MNELEKQGLAVFQKMQFKAFGNLGHQQVSKVFPNVTAGPDQHFEFDYFILWDDICIVAEMSGISNGKNINSKYQKFQKNFEILRSSKNTETFSHFDIPGRDLHLFDTVKSLHALFIAHEHESYDLSLSRIPNVSVIYKEDWATIKIYAEYMEKFARYPFLDLIGLSGKRDLTKNLRMEGKDSKLIWMPNRIVAREIGLRADVFIFERSPIDLLNIAEVYRRELMPVIAFTSSSNYQRRLDIKKLEKMEELVKNTDFIFPNSILVALDKECEYNMEKNKLIIPEKYGSISIIDGQHRLFSYASKEISDKVRENAKILVTALKFKTRDDKAILRCSAKTFIEINREQKRISSDHINEISYDILGLTEPKALAMAVIVRCNQKTGKPLHGMFSSSQNIKGVYQPTTISESLGRIMNIKYVNSLVNPKGNKEVRIKLGYQRLFGVDDIKDICDASRLVDEGATCLERYSSYIREVFPQDWPERRDLKNDKGTALGYAKVFAGFIILLHEFIYEGCNWDMVKQELKEIRKNILSKCGHTQDYAELVLDVNDDNIPNSQPSPGYVFKFLYANRTQPTNITDAKKVRSLTALRGMHKSSKAEKVAP